MAKITPRQIVKDFENMTLKTWGQYEHIIIALHYAMKNDSTIELMGYIRCAFIRRGVVMNPTSTSKDCTERWNESKSWFWVNICFNLVKQNPTLILSKLVKVAEKKGYMDKMYVYKFYKAKFIDSKKARSIISIEIKKESFI